MSFIIISVIVLAVVMLVSMWVCLTINVHQHSSQYPVLSKVTSIGNLLIILVCLAVIIRFNLWC